MIINPKVFGYICTTAHPIGCFKNVETQIDYIKSRGEFEGPKNVLVIGASTGYGLASRIAAQFGAKANTLGVIFEKEAEKNRTASPGWYNTAAFEKIAHDHNYYAKTVNGDAFSSEIKEMTANLIRNDLKTIDLIIYSIATPRRKHPVTGQVFNSTLKAIGQPFTSKTLEPFRREIKEVTIEAATETEIEDTIAVMGGEDWELWIDFLKNENLLSPGIITVAYTYIGPPVSYPIYKDGTIGKAKEHLLKTAYRINEKLMPLHGNAFISVNKAVVTQASAAIPIIPLYMSLLLKVMKEQDTNENCIEQINRLFKDKLYSGDPLELDSEGRIRLDDLEMQQDVQDKIAMTWPLVSNENLTDLADVNEFCDEFLRLFGFNVDGVNYAEDSDIMVGIDSLNTKFGDLDQQDLVIKIVTEQDKLDEIFKLRYLIYKDVIKAEADNMNHDSIELIDEVDRKSHIFGAYYKNKLVGSLRGFNYKDFLENEIEFVKAYDIFSYKDACRDNSAEVGRMFVLSEYQQYAISFLMMKEVIKFGRVINPNLKYIFMETYELLVKYYEFLHFKQIAAPIFNHHYKVKTYPMCLELDSAIKQFYGDNDINK